MPNGTRHWPLTGYNRYRAIAAVRQYQLIQFTPEDVEVRLVTDGPVSPMQETELGNHIVATLGHPFRLRFRYFEGRLPLPPSGKFEEFVCLVPG